MKLNSRFIVSLSFLLEVALYKFSAPALKINDFQVASAKAKSAQSRRMARRFVSYRNRSSLLISLCVKEKEEKLDRFGN